MTHALPHRPIATRHPLPASEIALEAAELAKVHDHFARFSGTLREAYDAMTLWTPLAPGITCEAVEQDGQQGWWVRPDHAPSGRAVLFLHGGAYGLGSAWAYRGLASQLASRAGVAAYVPDYPLAPEAPFPAAPHAVAEAFAWLATQGIAEVALAGDSAGSALALAALAQQRTGGPAIRSLVLFSPWLDLTFSGASFLDPATHDPIFKPQMLRAAAEAYLAGADPRDGLASPLLDVPMALPPLAIQVGTDEVLLDDATRYAEVAAARGGKVRLDVYEGLHHVFQRSAGTLPSADRALDTAAAFLSAHW